MGCKSSRGERNRLVLQPRGLARNLRPRHRPKTHQRLASGHRGTFLVGGGRPVPSPQPARQFVLWRIAKLLIYRMSPGVPNVSFYSLVTLPANPLRYPPVLFFNALAG
jgi:hypothetical protein